MLISSTVSISDIIHNWPGGYTWKIKVVYFMMILHAHYNVT